MLKTETPNRILVVDDEELNRDLLMRRLSRKGFTVVCADGAAEADQRLEESSIDLILLDIMMPVVDGYEYLERIRERWQPAQMPVIMATAKTESEDVVRALKLGANDYVTKPLDFQVVLARVETQLKLKHATEQLAAANRLLEDDLKRAAKFQQSQLPSANLTVPGCEFAWSYNPCDALAGDFLNVIPLDESQTAFYVLDVCGHGTPAALQSASVGRALAVIEDESSVVTRYSRKGFMRGNRREVVPPAEVTERLNRQFTDDIDEGKYFTMAYMVVDIDAGKLTYTLAGHPPQVFVPKGASAQLLECRGVPVGLLDDADLPPESFQQKSVDFAAGDRVYLFSDGLVEATNTDDEQLSSEGLRQIIDQAQSLSISESIQQIIELVRGFCGDQPFDDDLSILGIEFV